MTETRYREKRARSPRPAPEQRAEEPAEGRREHRTESLAELTGLFSELTRETTLLMRQEVALARAELDEKVQQVERGVISLSGGAAVVYAGILFLALAAVFALALVVPAWGAALIVGAALALVGTLLLGKGRSDVRSANLKPERTMDTTRRAGHVLAGDREEEHQ